MLFPHITCSSHSCLSVKHFPPLQHVLWLNSHTTQYFVHFSILFIEFRERKGERKTSTCSTYLRIHWLISACALPGDPISNLGASERCSDPLTPGQRLKRTMSKCTVQWVLGQPRCCAAITTLVPKTFCSTQKEPCTTLPPTAPSSG